MLENFVTELVSAELVGSELKCVMTPKQVWKLIGKVTNPYGSALIPHCCYATPKAHQYFPLPPPDAPIFIPDIETL